jgi:hypothetical protein
MGPQQRVARLAPISDALPLLVASAYWLYMERRLAEASIDAWMVAEQIIDHWWQNFLDELGKNDQAEWIKKKGVLQVAKRVQALHDADALDLELYKMLDAARKHRNNLAHRIRVDVEAAQTCMLAMKAAIEQLIGERVSDPFLFDMVSW